MAGIVNANPANVVRVPNVHPGFSRGQRGYIVMDFVHGETIAERKFPEGNYHKKDIEAVAAAVQQLIGIKIPPGTAPGPPSAADPSGTTPLLSVYQVARTLRLCISRHK